MAGRNGRKRPAMDKFTRAVLLNCLIAALALAGAAPLAAQAQACHGAQQARQVAELLFGRDVGHSVGVGEAAWARFVARELTPRFPDGLTISDAIGQWRNPASGTIVREPTKRVEIVLAGKDDDEAKLDAVAKAYKREFREHSVGIIVRGACVKF
jgi:Protein of unknown function (DUF3574)